MFRLQELLSERSRDAKKVVVVGPPAAPRPSDDPVPRIPPVEPSPWWPSSVLPRYALTPPPGLACQALAGVDLPVVSVLVFGLIGGRLRQVVRSVANSQRRTLGFKPVFLTDSTDHRPFQHGRFAFEYFPPSVYGRDEDRARNPLFQARTLLLGRKWGFTASLDLSSPVARRATAEQTAADKTVAPSLGGRPVLPAVIKLVRDSGLFDEAWYQRTYSDAAGEEPIEHYLREGAAKGYDPNPLFRTVYYARQMMAARARRSR